MTTLTMPTRELVGLIGDVLPFVSPDDEDTTWHRVVLRYDGTRLHAMAGDGLRLAWMSWGPDDSDTPTLPIPGWDPSEVIGDDPWELAILPENAKEIATKFQLPGKLAEAPVRVVGSADEFRVERDSDPNGNVSLKTVALSRPWDHNAPRIDDAIGAVAEAAEAAHNTRSAVAYSGFSLADFCDPKRVRQLGVVVFRFGPTSTYLRIGRWFRGAVTQAQVPRDA